MSRLAGFDVSNNNGRGDWRQSARAGYTWAAIKASEGTGYVDPYLSYNWAYSRGNGLTGIAYHFLNAAESGTDQAEYFHQAVHDHGRFKAGDGAMLDLETLNYEQPEVVQECAELFIAEARRLCGRNVVLYSTVYFLRSILEGRRSPIIESCPKFYASWGQLPSPDARLGPVSFWQYSATGRVPGWVGDVDLDYFLGTRQQLSEVLRAP